jgi:hypothetical protein
MAPGMDAFISNSVAQNGDRLARAVLREALAGNRRVTILLSSETNPLQVTSREFVDHGRRVLPLWIRSPSEAADLLSRWCGGREPLDERVVTMLVDGARDLLGIARPAGSITERNWQADAASRADTLETTIRFARSVLTANSGSPLTDVLAALDQLREGGLSQVEQFQVVAPLWGPWKRPIILLANQQFAGDDAERLAGIVRRTVNIAEAVPHLRLIVILDPPAWHRLQQSLDSHTLAILRDGMRFVDAQPRERAQAPAHESALTASHAEGFFPQAPVVEVPEEAKSIDALRERAQSALVTARNVGPAPRVSDDPPLAEYEVARSLAEALLFAALQADAKTSGLFRLNADGGFVFGNRTAEIDLLCRSLLIAIEVDGYFHFQDKEAYRRDRAKDWLMQRQGMAVLRFLAEDVTERLESIVERVIEVVQLRQAQRTAS